MARERVVIAPDGTTIYPNERSPELRKQVFLTHYRRHGIRAEAAERAGVTLHTVRVWYREDTAFREEHDQARAVVAAKYQRKLHMAALKGDTGAAWKLLQRMNPEEFGEERQGITIAMLPGAVPFTLSGEEIPEEPPVEATYRDVTYDALPG